MEIAALCCYAALLWHASRKAVRGPDAANAFFVNNRASGAVTVALSLVVSCVGASATMGMAGLAFKVGTPAFWWLGAGAIGITLLAVLLAAKVRESGSYTMPEMVSGLLGPRVRPLVSGIIVVAWMAILAAQFLALSKLLEPLLPLPPTACLGVGFLLIVVHTLGGQAVVMRTDRLQSAVLFLGLGILLFHLWRANPQWTASVRPEAVNADFTAATLCHYLFVVGGNYLVCPMLFGRLLSARDAGAARTGGLLAGAGLAVCAAAIVVLGLASRGLIPPDTAPDDVLTAAVGVAVPHWLGVFVYVALISAVVSSADSCLITAATVMSYDLLRTDRPACCRASVIALGCVGAALTFLGKGILEFLFMAYDIYVAGVVMPVFVALLWNRRRIRRPGLPLAAVALGGGLGLLAAVTARPAFSYAGMLLAAILTFVALLRGEKS